MLQVSLEFAPGTGEAVKQLAQMLPAGALLQNYRIARRTFLTADIVLVVGDHDPSGFDAMPRSEYVKKALSRNTAKQLAVLPIANQSAHQRTKSPEEADAFWLVIESRGEGLSIMCAIVSVQHITETAVN